MIKSINELSEKLKKEYTLIFRLYNATYRIMHIENYYYLEQLGINHKAKDTSLEELLSNSYAYGDSLIDLIDKMIFL